MGVGVGGGWDSWGLIAENGVSRWDAGTGWEKASTRSGMIESIAVGWKEGDEWLLDTMRVAELLLSGRMVGGGKRTTLLPASVYVSARGRATDHGGTAIGFGGRKLLLGIE